MDALVHWFLVYIVSPLALPLVVVATLCLLFDVRPEPIIKTCLDLAGSVFFVTCKLAELIVRTIYEVWRKNNANMPPRPLPKSTRRPKIYVDAE